MNADGRTIEALWANIKKQDILLDAYQKAVLYLSGFDWADDGPFDYPGIVKKFPDGPPDFLVNARNYWLAKMEDRNER